MAAEKNKRQEKGHTALAQLRQQAEERRSLIEFNTAISLTGKANFWRNALELLGELEHVRLQPDTITYSSVISACVLARKGSIGEQHCGCWVSWSVCGCSQTPSPTILPSLLAPKGIGWKHHCGCLVSWSMCGCSQTPSPTILPSLLAKRGSSGEQHCGCWVSWSMRGCSQAPSPTVLPPLLARRGSSGRQHCG